MLELKSTTRFKRDYKRIKKQGKDSAKPREVLNAIANQEALPERMHDHLLLGNYGGHRECHIEPDWLLIYLVDEGELILTAVRTGSHSELLGL